MAHTSFVLIAGLIFLIRYEVPEAEEQFNDAQVAFWICILTTVPVLLAYLTKRLTTLRPMIVFEILSLVGYVYILYQMNLPGFINKHLAFLESVHHSREIFSLIPLFIGLLGIRFVMQEVPQRRTELRWELLSFNFRLLLLPLIPLLVINAVFDLTHLLPETVQPFVGLGLLLPLLVLPFIIAPLMMQFLWKTEPLTNIVLKQRLQQLTERSGIKYQDIAVCQTGSLAIANAAVAGIIPRNRKIFITDALLRNFTDEQIETIVAHEIGHIRHRHLLISGCLVFGYLISSILFYQLIGNPLKSLLTGYSIISSIISVIFFVFYFKVFFNYLSRRFEHQADLYAVDLTNNREAFKSALESLGFLSALPTPIRFILEIFNTHPSIERRIQFLDRATEENSHIQRYRKCLLEVKVLLALIPIFGILIFLINW
ncbi:MAG: M48 family metalloprotease [Candidatus Poribacteria bacterium]|nr:M48 family metalloprotease [Candidatus Poribacteria bacterium]